MTGIYKITSPSDRIYIGQSINVLDRLLSYHVFIKSKLQPKLHKSFKKYGVENHIFEVLELCNSSELNERERYYQEKFDCVNGGLNCKLTTTKTKTGWHSEETKKKIGDGNRGKVIGEATLKRMSLATLGRRHTDESKSKISRKTTGGLNPKAKLVIDFDSGIYYECLKDASIAKGINYKLLKSWMTFSSRNKTNLKYV